MSLGTDYITPDQRIADNDYRSGKRATESSDEADTLSAGWTWVAALLVAGLFVVSGYLDQESGIHQTSSVSGVSAGQVSSISIRQARVEETNWANRQADKGY